MQLTTEQPLTGESWIPPKKDTPCPRAKEKTSKIIGGAKLRLEPNPILTRDIQQIQTKPCVHQDPGTSQETEPKEKQQLVVGVTGDRSKVQCCKKQHCRGTWNVRSMNEGKLETVKQEIARVASTF